MKTTTENKTTFADLLRRYETQAAGQTNSTAYATALTDLATAVAYSVLRKVIDPTRNAKSDRPSDSGINPALIALRNDLTRDRAYLARLDYATNGATRIGFNADGDPVQEVVDKDLCKAASALCRGSLGDGLDLVNDAVVCILAETEKARERAGGALPAAFMEHPYNVRRLKRKVWIKTENSVGGWETVDTTPIQEVYKAVRRSVQSSRHVQTDPRNGYTYIADLAIDPETGDGSTIYRRLAKYADMGSDGTTERAAGYIPGQPAGLDGRPTDYSADIETVETIDKRVAAMTLTDRETTVLKYRLSGYGYKAIATAMGITIDNAKRCGRRIREKATAAGLTPSIEK